MERLGVTEKLEFDHGVVRDLHGMNGHAIQPRELKATLRSDGNQSSLTGNSECTGEHEQRQRR